MDENAIRDVDLSTLCKVILDVLWEKGSFKFRTIEAWVVIKGYDVPTSDVKKALAHLMNEKKISQNERFYYKVNV